MTDINDIKARIVKLSKMTTENGCSEAEAMTAAAKIAAILDEHGMTEAEIKSFSREESGNKMETADFGNKKKLHEVQYCVNGIAKFFDVKVWASTTRENRTIRFFGFPGDVAAAIALTETLVYAMESDFDRFMASKNNYFDGVHGKTLRKNFMLGFAHRVTERLRELKVERNPVTTGTALVVLKNQVVETEAAKLNLNLKAGSANRTTGNTAAYAAGMTAGGRVNLGNTKQIGN